MFQNHPIYAPMGYQPNSKPDPEVIIPARVIKLAKDAGGEFIHKDGIRIFKWLFNQMLYADYDGRKFGSWFPWLDEDIPTGELKEL